MLCVFHVNIERTKAQNAIVLKRYNTFWLYCYLFIIYIVPAHT